MVYVAVPVASSGTLTVVVVLFGGVRMKLTCPAGVPFPDVTVVVIVSACVTGSDVAERLRLVLVLNPEMKTCCVVEML